MSTSQILISEVQQGYKVDPYWDNAAMLLLNAVIAFLVEECRPYERTLENLRKLVCAFEITDM